MADALLLAAFFACVIGIVALSVRSSTKDGAMVCILALFAAATVVRWFTIKETATAAWWLETRFATACIILAVLAGLAVAGQKPSTEK